MKMRTQTKLIILIGAVKIAFVINVLYLFYIDRQLSDRFLLTSKAEKTTQAIETLELLGKPLKTLVNDYSWGEEMVDFAEAPDSVWGVENLQTGLKSFHAHATWVYNADTCLVYTSYVSGCKSLVQDTMLEKGIRNSLLKGPFNQFYAFSGKTLTEIRTAPIQPLSDTDRTSPAQGYFAAADILDSSYQAELATVLQAEVSAREFGGLNHQPGEDSSLSSGQFFVDFILKGPDSIGVADLHCKYNSAALSNIQLFHFRLMWSSIVFSIGVMILLAIALMKWVSNPLREIMKSLRSEDASGLEKLKNAGAEFQKLGELVREFFEQNAALRASIAEQSEMAAALMMSEDSLRKEKKNSELILQSAGQGILRIDRTGYLTYMNNTARKILGWQDPKASKRAIRDFYHLTPDDQDADIKWEKLISETLLDGKVRHGENEYFRKEDGSVVPVEFTIAPIEEDVNARSVVVQFRDISETKKTNEQLGKLWQAIKQSPVSIIVTDLKGNIEIVNPKFLEVSGYSEEEIIGKNPRILKSGVHTAEFYASLWETLASGNTWHGEFLNRHKGGGLFWELVSIAPVRNREGMITHYVAVKEDITERKKTEQQLEEAMKRAEAANRAKSAFVASMSHEIRTPMNAILGYAQLLAREPSLGAGLKQYVDTINRSGEHLLNLLNDILEMSKIEAGRVIVDASSFNLPDLLSNLDIMFRMKAQSAQLAFNVEIADDIPTWVLADEGKIRQILINLLGNAIKFTKQGSVTMRASILNENGAKQQLLIEVEDTGFGIAKEEQRRLFENFEQTESGRKAQAGTGLGLALSKGFAQLLGGTITVRSELGVGSTFRVQIPIAPGVETDKPKKLTQGSVTGLQIREQAPKILLADDQEANRGWLGHILQPIGFSIREANDGKEAVRIWREWQPDLILMDLRMPVMTGEEAALEIRKDAAGRDVVIIALTANAFREHKKSILEAGMNDMLSKPLKVEDLFEMIQTHLKIEYTYGLESEGVADDAIEASSIPSREEIAEIPESLIEELRDATLAGDVEQFLTLTKTIATSNPSLARALDRLVERYEYDKILGLLTPTEANAHTGA